MIGPVSTVLYREAFKEERQKVLEELTSLFYDRSSYTKGDPYETAFNEGQRSVILFILQKLSQVENKDG